MSPRMFDADEPEDMDVAGQVSYEDTGRPWAARAIKHPSHARTRRHFAANPLPTQADRRAS
ncbi:hypothetical protein ACFZB4_18350 [Streptomyces pseudovenezuelae]|uniref:hypothetical protein n=1 Tax=Streptomyces pseudovenezuelae TaxID=67350 RepID=UPI0036E0E89F